MSNFDKRPESKLLFKQQHKMNEEQSNQDEGREASSDDLSSKRHNRKGSRSVNRMELHTIILATGLVALCLACQLAQAGGKGKGGGEGNIIISTGGGQSTKIKIMKVPVPYPVIKHVPYPVPVPIIQKKYVPVEKYIPVYKHHHHGGHEGHGGYESQQNEQYGPVPAQSAGQEAASSSNTANNYESSSSAAAAAASLSSQPSPMASYNSYQQMYGGSSMPAAQSTNSEAYGGQMGGNPFAGQMAASNGFDVNNIYSGSSGYSVGYGADSGYGGGMYGGGGGGYGGQGGFGGYGRV